MNKEELEIHFIGYEKDKIYDFLIKGKIFSIWKNHKYYFSKYEDEFWFKAATKGHLNVVKFLVDIGVDIETKNDDGRTALMLASWNNKLEMVNFLIENGANINVEDGRNYTHDGGQTSLMLAAFNGHFDIFKVLIEAKADINHNSVLSDVAQRGYLNIVEFLLDVSTSDELGKTELNNALRVALGRNRSRLDIVELLIEKGADINTKSDDGHTLLMSAASCGFVDVVEFLVEKGVDIDAKDSKGRTALMKVKEFGYYPDIAKFLIKSGAINITWWTKFFNKTKIK